MMWHSSVDKAGGGNYFTSTPPDDLQEKKSIYLYETWRYSCRILLAQPNAFQAAHTIRAKETPDSNVRFGDLKLTPVNAVYDLA